MVGPDDFINKVFASEEFIEQETGICVGMPVQVQVESSVRSEKAMHQRKPGMEEIQVGIQVGPVVTIPFRHLPILGAAGVFPAPDAGLVVFVGKKGGIRIDQIQAAFKFRKQGSHDAQVVTQEDSAFRFLIRITDAVWIDHRVRDQFGWFKFRVFF